MKLRNSGSEVHKVATRAKRAKRDRTNNLPQTFEASKKLVKTPNKRAGAIAKEEGAKLIKLEHRENALYSITTIFNSI